MNHADRRRAIVATLVTAAALPALVVASRGEPSTAGTGQAPSNSSPPTTEYVPGRPVFVDDSAPPVVNPTVIEVVVPTVPIGQFADGRATFRRLTSTETSPCSTLLAPIGTPLTILNVDNGRSIECTNIGDVGMPEDIDVVIDTEVFNLLSNLLDAPISVRLNW